MIDVYIQTTTSTDDRTDYLVSTKSFMRDLSVKAKLILPADPEIVEAIYDNTDESCYSMNELTRNKLKGRRWKCKFEEIVE